MKNDKNKKSKLPLHLKFVFFRARLKRTLREVKRDKNTILISVILFLALLALASGLVVFTTFLRGLHNTYTFWGNGRLDLDTSAQVGNFIGGVVGALWSFTGTLLFFIALQLQRTELTEMRKESQINRLTNIIYQQLDFFDKSLQRFQILDIDNDQNLYRGIDAVIFLRDKVESVIQFKKEHDEDKKTEFARKYIFGNVALIMKNEKSLFALFESLDSSCDVIRAVLCKNSIPPLDLNELKAVFFKNIPSDLLNSADRLASILDGYLKKEEEVSHGEKRDRLFSPLHGLITKINAINEFRALVYDKENTKVTEETQQMYYST